MLAHTGCPAKRSSRCIQTVEERPSLWLLGPAFTDDLFEKVWNVGWNEVLLRTLTIQYGIFDRVRVHCNNSKEAQLLLR